MLPDLMSAFFIGPPHKPQMSLQRILSESEILLYKNHDASNKASFNKFKHVMFSAIVNSQTLLVKSLHMATFCK